MRRQPNGFTLIEILLAVTILAILLVVGIWSLRSYIYRAQDARRKSDLVKLKQVFQDYYNDHGQYPPTDVLQNYCTDRSNPILVTYQSQLPCDPVTKQAYLYLAYPDSNNRTAGFRLMTRLNNLEDPAITQLNCQPDQGCGLGLAYEDYVYGVSEGVPVAAF